jgi:hypothetical protein
MTLSIETLGDSTSFANRMHGPRPPFSSMSIEVAPGVQSPVFPIRLPSHTPNCRLNALGSGAPRGNKNALKRGRFTREAIAERGHIRELVRQARKLLLQIG